MTKNSLPAEEILKHICKYKKSRALGHEDKGATLSESGKNAQKYMFRNCWLVWVQLAIWLHGCCSFSYFDDDCSRKVFNNIKPGKDACQKKAENIEVIGKRLRTLKLGGGVLAIAHNLL